MKFPYPSLIFKEKKITKKEAFKTLKEDVETKKYIEETTSKVLFNRPFENCYFDRGDGLSNFYTEEIRMECSFNKKESPIKVFEKIILPEIKEKKLKFESYEDLENYIYKNYSKIYRVCNTFNPYVISSFIDHFVDNSKDSIKVLDPSSGWGDRLIGFLASSKGVEYTGFDPNLKLKQGYEKIIKDFNKNKTVNLNYKGFEESNLQEDYFDLAFTSPPFFDLEIYSDDKSQSVNEINDTYEKWLDFYTQYLNKTVSATKNVIVIYTANYNKYKLIEDTVKIITSTNKFKLSDKKYFFNTSTPKNEREMLIFERRQNSVELSSFPFHFNNFGTSYKEHFFKTLDRYEVKFNKENYFPHLKSISSNNPKKFINMYCRNMSSFSLNPSFDWKNGGDVLIDFYNEYARVNAKGFGETISPFDYWNLNKHLTRDELYNTVQEARLAYASQSKGLIEYVNNLGVKNILDIAAYGDRMVAYSTLNNNNIKSYTGIDPDINLRYDNLIQDIKLYTKNTNVSFFPTSFENFSLKSFDMILVSPPPYKAEKYSSSEKQSYNMYSKGFKEWVEGFLVSTIIRKSNEVYTRSSNNPFFAFTALDRTKENEIDDFKISYVELFCLLIENCSDFSFNSLLLFGNSKIPWFFFNKKDFTSSIKADLTDKFNYLFENYPDFKDSKIIQNLIINKQTLNGNWVEKLTNLFLTKNRIKEKNYDFTIITEKHKNSNVANEKIRYHLVMYICNIIYLNCVVNYRIINLSFDKIVTFFSRWLMMASSFCYPLERFMSCDTFFTDITNNEDIIRECNTQFINSILEKTNKISVKELENIFYDKEYLFEAKENYKELCTGLAGLVRSAGIYMYYITLTNYSENNSYENDLERLVPFSPKRLPFTTSERYDEQRYSALGAVAHHYTRPITRAKILCEALYEESVIDMFATTFNSNSINSQYYFSLYPDVEENSLGNVYYISEIKKGFFMANVMDIPYYTVYTANFINKFLMNSDSEITFYVSFVIWKDTKDYEKIINNKLENFSENLGLKRHYEINKQFIKASVIIDKNKFPTTDDPYKEGFKTSRNDLAISFGIVLSNKKNFEINKEMFSQLGIVNFF